MLSRRGFLGAASGASLIPSLANAQARRPPNIILVLADDLGWGDLGCYGSPDIRTPHLDRLAREGVRFTHFYAQPLCGPSRSALMTGCYPVRNSLMFNHLPKARTGIHPDEVTIPELLKTRGYATAIAGKWHLGDAPPFLPTRHGFDSWFGLPYSNDMWPFHPKIQKPRLPSAQGDIARARAEANGYEGKGQVYPPDWFPDLPLMRNEEVIELNPEQNRLTQRYTDTALDFINENRSRPFFFYLAHSMPHAPLFPGQPFEGRSRRGRYGDVVEELDDSVGRIRAQVQKLGLENDTLIIFTSDNGPWRPYGIDAGTAGPLRGAKGTHWEGGIRVPFIASLPGRIPFGLQSSEMMATIDLLPTFAAMARANVPKDRIIDGRSLYRPLTQKDARSPHDAFFYYAAPTNYLAADGRPANRQNLVAVRDRQWKLHLEAAPGGEKGALYDIHADPGEERDVSSQHPDVVGRLRALAESFNAKLSTEIRPLGRLDG